MACSTPVAGHISTASRVCEFSTGGATQSNSALKQPDQAARWSRLLRLFSAASSYVRVKRASAATRASQRGRLSNQSFAALVSWVRLEKLSGVARSRTAHRDDSRPKCRLRDGLLASSPADASPLRMSCSSRIRLAADGRAEWTGYPTSAE